MNVQTVSAVVEARNKALRKAGEALLECTNLSPNERIQWAIATYEDYWAGEIKLLVEYIHPSDINKAIEILELKRPAY